MYMYSIHYAFKKLIDIVGDLLLGLSGVILFLLNNFDRYTPENLSPRLFSKCRIWVPFTTDERDWTTNAPIPFDTESWAVWNVKGRFGIHL